MNTKIVMMSLIVAVLISIVANPVQALIVTVTETRITTDPGVQAGADIHGNRIVWHDDRSNDIYMYDLVTESEVFIPLEANETQFMTIYGDIIVWVDYNRVYASGMWSYYDIYMYDLSTSTEQAVCADNSWQCYPAVYENKIVWADKRNSDQDIYMKDLSTNIETRISTDSSDQTDPAIHGDLIVWTDYRNDDGSETNPDIYMYNLTTSTETPICTNPFAQDAPAIYGNIIVWQDLRNGGSDVYMYDLATSTETKLNTVTTNDPCSLANPRVYGDIVVWTDYRNSNYDIYMYNLSTSTETPVCTHSADQSQADIYQNRIVWTDYRISPANPEIYLGEISFATPTEQSDNLQSIIANETEIPKSDFAGANDKTKDNRRNTLLNKLAAVTNAIQTAEASSDPSTINTAYQEAINQLNAILDVTDGCAERGTPDTKGSGYTPDWITTCTSQAKIDPHIRDLIATLEALITP